MPGPAFYRPRTIEEAVAALGQRPGEWTPVAGGTDLLVRMRDGLARPRGLLDLTAIGCMKGIDVIDGHVRIGALSTHAEIAASETLRRHAGALVDAAARIGSPQIRNRGTIGGNIVNASPAADTVPALFVLDAEVGLIRAGSCRWVPIREFAIGPGKTVRRPEEILFAARFRVGEDGFVSGFDRLGARKALAISKVSAAFSAMVSPEGVLSGVKVALGAVAPTVIRSPSAEAALEGRTVCAESIEAAAAGAMENARPISDIRSDAEYRRAMCGVLVRRLVKITLTSP